MNMNRPSTIFRTYGINCDRLLRRIERGKPRLNTLHSSLRELNKADDQEKAKPCEQAIGSGCYHVR
jgi:hypothetical protein